MSEVNKDSLVLYKNRPARVLYTDDKLEIELEDGKVLKVRPKDVVLLHPGPLRSLRLLQAPPGEVDTAWELLAGSTTSLTELAELAYGDYTPASAWAAWQLVAEGLYFRGTPDMVLAASADEVSQVLAARAARQIEEQAWGAFMERLRAGKIAAEDMRYMKDVEDLALGRRTTSRVLRELNRAETPEKAHTLLLRLGHWEATFNPYPVRLNISLTPPPVTLEPLPQEARVDLTHLQAFAIDDEGSHDPDDAVSLDDSRLWVHIADVAALVSPGSPADLEARGRGANLYLPEGTIPMLPVQATELLGLGLTDMSPALSFALDLNAAGEITGVEVMPSWIRVTRLTYDEVEARLEEPPLQDLYRLAQAAAAHRQARGALTIELPEVKILVQDGQVTLRPLPPLRSRALVQEAMLLAGTAAARYAQEHGIPFPFTTQDPPEPGERPEGLAGMFALRRTLKRSQQTTVPGLHAGLGLDVYTRVTSPLRRYMDLVGHQQLRAFLRGDPLLSDQEVLERVGAAEAATGTVRHAEFLTEKHWILVYLLQHPDWRGSGILVERRERRGTFLIPELGLETRIHLEDELPLNSIVPLGVSGINLAELEVYFQLQS